MGELHHNFGQGASPPDAAFSPLSDCKANGKERPWRKHAIERAAVAKAMAQLPQRSYKRRAEAMSFCGRRMSFQRFECNGVEGKRLYEVKTCKDRLCPACQYLRSRKLHHQLAEVVTKHLQDNSGDRLLFLTLTVKNPGVDEFAATVSKMYEGFRTLTKTKRFKEISKGYFRVLEVTTPGERKADYGNDGFDGWQDSGKDKTKETYHPHFHVLLAVRGDYFDKNKNYYMTNDELRQMWKKAMGLDYMPMCNTQAVKGQVIDGKPNKLLLKSLLEVTKYCVKPADYIGENGEVEPLRLLHIGEAIKGRRLVAYGLGFKEAHKSLALEDIESDDVDLVNVDPLNKGLPEGATLLSLDTYTYMRRRPGWDYYLTDRVDCITGEVLNFIVREGHDPGLARPDPRGGG